MMAATSSRLRLRSASSSTWVLSWAARIRVTHEIHEMPRRGEPDQLINSFLLLALHAPVGRTTSTDGNQNTSSLLDMPPDLI